MVPISLFFFPFLGSTPCRNWSSIYNRTIQVFSLKYLFTLTYTFFHSQSTFHSISAIAKPISNYLRLHVVVHLSSFYLTMLHFPNNSMMWSFVVFCCIFPLFTLIFVNVPGNLIKCLIEKTLEQGIMIGNDKANLEHELLIDWC